MSKQTKTKQKIILKKNKALGKIWHPESELVFKSPKEKVVIGRYTDDVFVSLDEKALDLCTKWKFKYDKDLVEIESESEDDQNIPEGTDEVEETEESEETDETDEDEKTEETEETEETDETDEDEKTEETEETDETDEVDEVDEVEETDEDTKETKNSLSSLTNLYVLETSKISSSILKLFSGVENKILIKNNHIQKLETELDTLKRDLQSTNKKLKTIRGALGL